MLISKLALYVALLFGLAIGPAAAHSLRPDPSNSQYRATRAAAPQADVRSRTTAELPSDYDGKAVFHALYVLPSDAPDLRRDVNGQIVNALSAVRRWYLNQTGNLVPRIDQAAGVIDVTFVRLDETGAQLVKHGWNLRDYLEAKLKARGFNRSDKIYLAFYEGDNNHSCGDSFQEPQLPGNLIGIYLDSLPSDPTPCSSLPLGDNDEVMGFFEFAIAHEMGHALGFVAARAPDIYAGDGCSCHTGGDPRDLMYAGVDWWAPQALDINRRNYFRHGNSNLPDLASSRWLEAVGVVPQAGWWWSPGFAGQGFSIEVRGSSLFIATFVYSQEGAPIWYVASGQISNGRFTAPLQLYNGGATLSGGGSARQIGSAGEVSLTFSDGMHGTMTWPGGTIPIQRFEFAANGAVDGPRYNSPQAGWYWDPTQPGTGWFIEVQDRQLFLAGFLYAESGQPIWFVAQSPTEPWGFDGAELLEYANGPSFEAPGRPATLVGSLGRFDLRQWPDHTVKLFFPNGQRRDLVRFRF